MKLVFFSFFVSLPIVLCYKQRLVVRGTLMCKNQPYPDAQVKVVSKRIGFDNTLGDVKTDRSGQFSIDGSADEMTQLNPQLKIYHKCADNNTFSLNPMKLCKRRWVFEIPTDYISRSGNPTTLNVGSMNLELIPVEQDRDCI